MYRLFVAIELPERVKDRLLQICCGISAAKWFDETRLHLALRFIGEVDGAVFRDVAEALGTVESEPFDLTVSGVGFFPPRGNPETLWAGIERNESLVALHNRIESTLQRAGLPAGKRKFTPHIGLARLKQCPPEKVADFLTANSLLKLEPFAVEEFCLYSSFLSSEKALHQIEAEYPLTGK